MSEPVYDGYTREELKAAFERVQDPTNWKNPIKAVITVKDRDAETRVIGSAIDFFAGGGAEFQDGPKNTVRVRAPGYYVLIGA